MPHLLHSDSETPLTEWSDRDVMAAIAGGREDAYEELIDRKARPLLGLACRIVGDREEARDIVQLTFLRVWEHRTRYDGTFSVNTWIYRIATNLAIDVLRSRQVRSAQAAPVRDHMLRLVGGPSDLEGILRREVLGILRDLATGLSRRQRLAFLLRETEGLSTRETAEILGCRQSTVRNHLFVARKYLRAEIRRRFPEYAPESENPAERSS